MPMSLPQPTLPVADAEDGCASAIDHGEHPVPSRRRLSVVSVADTLIDHGAPEDEPVSNRSSLDLSDVLHKRVDVPTVTAGCSSSSCPHRVIFVIDGVVLGTESSGSRPTSEISETQPQTDLSQCRCEPRGSAAESNPLVSPSLATPSLAGGDVKTPSATTLLRSLDAFSVAIDVPSAVAVAHHAESTPETEAAAAEAALRALADQARARRICELTVRYDKRPDYFDPLFPEALEGVLPNVDYVARVRALNAELARRHFGGLRDHTPLLRTVAWPTFLTAAVFAFGVLLVRSLNDARAVALVAGGAVALAVVYSLLTRYRPAATVTRHVAEWNEADAPRLIRWASVRREDEAVRRVPVALLGCRLFSMPVFDSRVPWTVTCERVPRCRATSNASTAAGSVEDATAAAAIALETLPRYSPRWEGSPSLDPAPGTSPSAEAAEVAATASPALSVASTGAVASPTGLSDAATVVGGTPRGRARTLSAASDSSWLAAAPFASSAGSVGVIGLGLVGVIVDGSTIQGTPPPAYGA